jgi:hypothetical protein
MDEVECDRRRTCRRMIYSPVSAEEPIRQGDIFRNVPRVDFTLSSLAVIDDNDELKATTWREVLGSPNRSNPISAVLAVKPVMAIVITQNCDAARGESLSLCQIEDYLTANGQEKPPKDAKAWQSLLMRTTRTNSRFFYLPVDARFGVQVKLAVDFRAVLPVPRKDLESLRDYRIARLNPIALEHFRESLSHFFRRYAYNEWYPLTAEEFKLYAAQVGEPVTAYDWQK